MKTLYVSDLDGTLLNAQSRLSAYAVRHLNGLLDDGMLFTPATARSPFSAVSRLEALRLRLPALLMNGGLEYDLGAGKVLHMITLDSGDARRMLEMARGSGLEPLLYTYDTDDVQRVYTAAIVCPEQRLFIETRQSEGDKRFVIAGDMDAVLEQRLFYVTTFGPLDALEPLEERFSDMGLNCHLYEDVALRINLLEASGRGATKGEAVLRLRERLGAERLVAFGDNINDISMLEAADYAVVPANGVDAAKAVADEICPSCDEDGVVQWLMANVKT